jgi:hypothetical protein
MKRLLLAVLLLASSTADAAIITRYFSTSSAGAGDGTTWADRAALFSAGNWSTVITGFNFSGSDSLMAIIGPGAYTCSQSLASGLFSNAPTSANFLFLRGGDSSGNLLTPPDGNWTSDLPAWDDSGLPDIQTSTNISTINLAATAVTLFKFTATGATTNSPLGTQNSTVYNWVSVTNSASNTGASVVGGVAQVSNSVLRFTGTAYSAIASSPIMTNVRLEGNASASSGNRYGWSSNTASPALNRVTVINNPGGGIVSTASSTAFSMTLANSVVMGNAGPGILLPSTASQTSTSRLFNNYIANNGTYGIDAQSGARVLASWNRLRDNASGNFNGFGNFPTTTTNYEVDASDTELVNTAAGNYQVDSAATIWGMGFGVSEEAAAGGQRGGSL